MYYQDANDPYKQQTAPYQPYSQPAVPNQPYGGQNAQMMPQQNNVARSAPTHRAAPTYPVQ
ncbi:MAG: hypothetical protein ACXWOL_15410, partial [Ktedonobacteraceae bacterium]